MKKYILLITFLGMPLATQCMDSREEIVTRPNNNTDYILDTLYTGLGFASGCAIRAASIPLTNPHAEIYEVVEGSLLQVIGMGGIWLTGHRLINRGYFDRFICFNCMWYWDDEFYNHAD